MLLHTLPLIDSLTDAYKKNRWGKSKKDKDRPEIIFDKYACCNASTNTAHNTWWAYVQPPNHPRVVAYGKTLEDALNGLYVQFQKSPQERSTVPGAQNQSNFNSNGLTNQQP